MVQHEKARLPFHIEEGLNGLPVYAVNFEHEKKKYTPEEILSFVLARIKKNAEDFLGSEVTKAVLTAPSHFGYFERNALKVAG